MTCSVLAVVFGVGCVVLALALVGVVLALHAARGVEMDLKRDIERLKRRELPSRGPSAADQMAASLAVVADDEGASVTFLCRNPEGDGEYNIDAVGEWTDWKERRYSGRSFADAVGMMMVDYRS